MSAAHTSEGSEIRRIDPSVPGTAGQTTEASAPGPAHDWLAPAAIAVLLLLAAWYDGAFALRHWAPVALLTVVILAAAASAGALAVPERAARAALLALWVFAGWSLASMLWAESPARAVEGGARTVLYAALFTVPCAMTWAGRSAARAGALLMGGIGLIALVTLVQLLSDAEALFLAGRLDDPVGYRNATACLFALGFWPFVATAARWRLGGAALRALAFGAAALVLGLVFLTQARGAALGLALGGAVALGLGPDRLRRACCALILVAGVAVASGQLLTPYDAFIDQGGARSDQVDSAIVALSALVAAALAVGLVAALLDGGLRLHGRARQTARRLAQIALAGAALAAVAVTLVAIGSPLDFARDRIDEFKRLETAAPGESRLTFGGGQRADLWRIAVDEFQDDPLTGVGEGSYPFRYYEERRTDRNLSTPHSFVLRVLGELGAVGILCLVAFAVCLAVAVSGRWRQAVPESRWWASALLAAGVVGLGQATVDWIWLIPGVAGTSFLALGLGLASLRATRGEAPPSLRPLARVALAIGGIGLAVVISTVYLGDVYVRKARATTARPSERLDAGHKAESLLPWSTAPRYLQAGALEDLGRTRQARAALREALDLEPRNFVTYALMGDLEVRAGNLRRARRLYGQALQLNPRDQGLRELSRSEVG